MKTTRTTRTTRTDPPERIDEVIRAARLAADAGSDEQRRAAVHAAIVAALPIADRAAAKYGRRLRSVQRGRAVAQADVTQAAREAMVQAVHALVIPGSQYRAVSLEHSTAWAANRVRSRLRSALWPRAEAPARSTMQRRVAGEVRDPWADAVSFSRLDGAIDPADPYPYGAPDTSRRDEVLAALLARRGLTLDASPEQIDRLRRDKRYMADLAREVAGRRPEEWLADEERRLAVRCVPLQPLSSDEIASRSAVATEMEMLFPGYEDIDPGPPDRSRSGTTGAERARSERALRAVQPLFSSDDLEAPAVRPTAELVRSADPAMRAAAAGRGDLDPHDAARLLLDGDVAVIAAAGCNGALPRECREYAALRAARDEQDEGRTDAVQDALGA